MLTPMEIHDHQFKKGFRGYSENEVDDFLDKVVVDFEKLLRENERLKNQISNNEKELEHYRKLEKTLNDTLMVAQRTADEVITSARRNADDIKEQTARECQQIRDQVQFEAKQQLDSANAKRDAILAEYAKLVSEKHSFLMKLRTMLESELGLAVQMLSAVPKVEEAATRPLPETESVEIDESEKISANSDKEPSPVVAEKALPATDETKTYKPVKSVPILSKEAAK